MFLCPAAFAKQVEQIVANLAYHSDVDSHKVQAILFNNTQWQNDVLPAPVPAAFLSLDALTIAVNWAASYRKAHTRLCCMLVSEVHKHLPAFHELRLQ